MDRVTELNTQYLRGEQAMDLATIQGDYQQIISTNATAGSLFQSAMTGIATILDDPDMTPAQAASAVNQIATQLEGSLAMLAGINDMNFGDITGTVPGGALPGTPDVNVNNPFEDYYE